MNDMIYDVYFQLKFCFCMLQTACIFHTLIKTIIAFSINGIIEILLEVTKLFYWWTQSSSFYEEYFRATPVSGGQLRISHKNVTGKCNTLTYVTQDFAAKIQ
jgi:hypothetical protein